MKTLEQLKQEHKEQHEKVLEVFRDHPVDRDVLFFTTLGMLSGQQAELLHEIIERLDRSFN